MDMIIKNGLLVDPKSGTKKKLDILIEDGYVTEIGENIRKENAKILDAEGMIVTPGFVDIHVHLREPGFEYKETIETGTKSAVAGGFTTIACMPNTNPAIHSKKVIDYINQKSETDGCADMFVIGSITKNILGKQLSPIRELIEAGVVAISDDGKTPMNEEIMLNAFKEAKKYDIPLISHCEDHSLSKGGSINEGSASKRTGIRGIPSSAEYLIVERDIELCDKTSSKLHIAHVSTKESVEIIKKAKDRGLNITCEVAPHHFMLTDEIITKDNTYTKVNPPIRSREDVKKIIEGILNGTIDIIATDHAPHDEESKKVEYKDAAFGISGLETAFSLSYTELVLKNNIPIMKLIEMLTIKPAEILGIDRGYIAKGVRADITIINLDKQYKINSDKFYSKGKNTPFNGYRVQGKPMYTIVNGELIYERGKINCL